MPLIVKGLRAGLGLASEAIHANRDKKKAESNTDAPTASSASRPSNSSESDKEWCDDQGLQFEDGATTYSDATSDEAKLKERERLTRQLVAMAGPAPITPPAYPLPVPVIVPQRRARQRARGFAPAYAPVLADCGISQDVFVKFVQDLNTVNRVCHPPP